MIVRNYLSKMKSSHGPSACSASIALGRAMVRSSYSAWTRLLTVRTIKFERMLKERKMMIRFKDFIKMNAS